MTACSVSGESARYKSQAEQSAAQGHLAEAVLTYRQALISHPEDPELLSKLGLALAAQGRGRSAADVLERASILKPEATSIKKALADLVTRPQDGLSLTLAWIYNNTNSEPVGAGINAGKIFVAYADGHLLALDQGSGQGYGILRRLPRWPRRRPPIPGRSGLEPKMDRFLYMMLDQGRNWAAMPLAGQSMLPQP